MFFSESNEPIYIWNDKCKNAFLRSTKLIKPKLYMNNHWIEKISEFYANQKSRWSPTWDIVYHKTLMGIR
jgi:hypothetical protein